MSFHKLLGRRGNEEQESRTHRPRVHKVGTQEDGRTRFTRRLRTGCLDSRYEHAGMTIKKQDHAGMTVTITRRAKKMEIYGSVNRAR